MKKRKFNLKLFITVLTVLFLVVNVQAQLTQVAQLMKLVKQGQTIKRSSELQRNLLEVLPHTRKIENHHGFAMLHLYKEKIPIRLNDNLKSVVEFSKIQGYNEFLRIDRSKAVNKLYIDKVLDADHIKDLVFNSDRLAVDKAYRNQYFIKLKTGIDDCFEEQFELLEISVRAKSSLLKNTNLLSTEILYGSSIVLPFKYYENNDKAKDRNNSKTTAPNIEISISPIFTFHNAKALQFSLNFSTLLSDRLRMEPDYKTSKEFQTHVSFFALSLWDLYHVSNHSSEEDCVLVEYLSKEQVLYRAVPIRNSNEYTSQKIPIFYIEEFYENLERRILDIEGLGHSTNALFRTVFNAAKSASSKRILMDQLESLWMSYSYDLSTKE